MKFSITRDTPSRLPNEPTATWEIKPGNNRERDHFEEVYEIVKRDMPVEQSRDGTLRFATSLSEMRKLQRILSR